MAHTFIFVWKFEVREKAGWVELKISHGSKENYFEYLEVICNSVSSFALTFHFLH